VRIYDVGRKIFLHLRRVIFHPKKLMAIAQSELLRAGQRRPLLKSQVRVGLQRTAFLCHSHRDYKLAEGL